MIMKQLYYYPFILKTILALFFTAVITTGCEKQETFPSESSLNSIKTKGSILNSPECDWTVRIDDVYAYLKTKPEQKDIVSIAPYPSNTDSYCYIINYNDGWEVISGDKRTPITIAEGKTGSFTPETLPTSIKSWLEAICSDIELLPKMPYSSLEPIERERMDANVALWETITSSFSAKKDVSSQKGFNEPGIWLENGITIEYEVVDSIKHILSTRWHQEAPFNNYSPLFSPGNPTRTLAGCVAICGAQMLYFLHDELGVPQYAPTDGLSTGYAYNGTNSFSSWGSSSSIWDYMSTSLVTTAERDTSAILIADVGMRMGMNYGVTVSSSDFSSLVQNVFNYYGLSCTASSYLETTVNSNLLNGYPVPLGAFPSPLISVGHAFIIDGYKRTRMKETRHFIWQPDPDYVGIQPHLPGETMDVIYYSSPEITMYGINWGIDLYDNMSYENAWYRVDGDWYLGQNNYIWNRSMITGFSVL